MDKRTGLRKSQKRARRDLIKKGLNNYRLIHRAIVMAGSAWLGEMIPAWVADLERQERQRLIDALSLVTQPHPMAAGIGYGHVRDIGEMLTPQSAPDSPGT